MTIMHDADLIQRLHFAENNLLTSLLDDTKMLASYHQMWSALLGELTTASQNGNVGHETLSLAHVVATRILKIASCFLDIKRDEEYSTAQLQKDCDAMFHQMADLNINAQPKSSHLDNTSGTPRPSTCSNAPFPNVEGSSPLFLASAYQWLLDNLHNPYPTAEVKTRVAATSSCQVSSVNSWFINARRRIGWTTLCRERFSNCRADMIDAAYRALVNEDSRCTLSPELRHSFVAMKVAAEGLYSSTFTRSALAGDLDVIVKDMTEEDRISIEVGECRNLTKAARDSYPSPDRSISASPVPALDDSLTDESGEEVEEDVTPPIIAGSKRRRSSIEPVNQLSSTARRPIKRLRASMTSRTYLPSPPSSTDDIDGSLDHGSPELSLVHSTQPETNKVLPSRKRRLSDPDATEITKRTRSLMASPRLHSVSDPLPRSNMENDCSIDDWFNTNFDSLFAIPPPVDATEPDFSASWEVELFRDYNIPEIPKHAPKCPPAPMADAQISAPTDLSDLESLLQSIGGDTFVTPPECVPPSDMAGAPYTTPLHSSIPDILQTNIDWTSLLHGTEVQPTIYSTFPQYPTNSQSLPEIDLSILQLPHAVPTVNPQGDFASKQAKLHQLHAMQEAVRRMEQELQSEGVVI